MNHREQAVDDVARLLNGPDRADRAVAWLFAQKIVAAILPQVSTVEELVALPPETYLIGETSDRPHFWRRREMYDPGLYLRSYGPFTAWRP